MSVTAMGRALLMLAVAALVIGTDGYAASEPASMMLAQRGGRGGRGQGSPGIRALVKGHVTAVDSTLGRITLAIGGATLEAEFRPALLADVKPGDDVLVTVELIDTRVGVVAGPVTAVDPASGAVTVSTPGGPWTNTFLPGAIAGIKPGDQVILKLDLLDLGPSVVPPSMPPPGQPSPRGGGTTR
ncbi:MAG TPA: hypothetical protein VL086_22215 [Candidatus Nitrosotalea sp.]|jgi:hypothetical protein|nr:hypothetical protein [Candidatus Nitrosotalea sp.]